LAMNVQRPGELAGYATRLACFGVTEYKLARPLACPPTRPLGVTPASSLVRRLDLQSVVPDR
ncbi:MAG TPA: hypothetical protein VF701_16365, partial [Thermoanaerobaculia bacterium]